MERLDIVRDEGTGTQQGKERSPILPTNTVSDGRGNNASTSHLGLVDDSIKDCGSELD
jgi:hypothetical protein